MLNLRRALLEHFTSKNSGLIVTPDDSDISCNLFTTVSRRSLLVFVASNIPISVTSFIRSFVKFCNAWKA